MSRLQLSIEHRFGSTQASTKLYLLWLTDWIHSFHHSACSIVANNHYLFRDVGDYCVKSPRTLSVCEVKNVLEQRSHILPWWRDIVVFAVQDLTRVSVSLPRFPWRFRHMSECNVLTFRNSLITMMSIWWHAFVVRCLLCCTISAKHPFICWIMTNCGFVTIKKTQTAMTCKNLDDPWQVISVY
jgi:hypothetical protein